MARSPDQGDTSYEVNSGRLKIVPVGLSFEVEQNGGDL